ncbi:hypothetical protein V8J88_22160 [Massilia sp. W12]|uniref:hypothetical protein n=1 Tax=Massilia sp. W12 TaxID=3126507 RepID=UPI0030CAADC9
MNDEIFTAEISQDHKLQLPAEAIEVLGSNQSIFLKIDKEKRTVVLSSAHPDILHNREIMDQIVALNEEMGLYEFDTPESEKKV